MSECTLLFDGSSVADIDYFLFYLEKVVRTEGSQEENARTLIQFLRGEEFQFFYQKFTEEENLSQEGMDYGKVCIACEGEV